MPRSVLGVVVFGLWPSGQPRWFPEHAGNGSFKLPLGTGPFRMGSYFLRASGAGCLFWPFPSGVPLRSRRPGKPCLPFCFRPCTERAGAASNSERCSRRRVVAWRGALCCHLLARGRYCRRRRRACAVVIAKIGAPQHAGSCGLWAPSLHSATLASVACWEMLLGFQARSNTETGRKGSCFLRTSGPACLFAAFMWFSAGIPLLVLTIKRFEKPCLVPCMRGVGRRKSSTAGRARRACAVVVRRPVPPPAGGNVILQVKQLGQGKPRRGWGGASGCRAGSWGLAPGYPQSQVT